MQRSKTIKFFLTPNLGTENDLQHESNSPIPLDIGIIIVLVLCGTCAMGYGIYFCFCQGKKSRKKSKRNNKKKGKKHKTSAEKKPVNGGEASSPNVVVAKVIRVELATVNPLHVPKNNNIENQSRGNSGGQQKIKL